MNERIEKLVEQATEYDPFCGTEIHFDKEKFAELIIDECLAECWYDYTPLQISDNIKTKFGVE